MKNEPIKHHYIPRFILKNFCFDDKGNVLYFDKLTHQVSVKNIREVFMVKNLYRDDTNDPTDRMKIEKDLAKFESDIAHIIKEKFLTGKDVFLTKEDDEKLKLFFAIMGFRSKNAAYLFGEGITKESKRVYSQFQTDEDITAFWKRNLGYLVNCRSLKEVLEHNEIDTPIKVFMWRDVFGAFGLHFSVVQCSDDCEGFICGDAYPVVVDGKTNDIQQLRLYAIHPLSPDRVILLVGNGADHTPRNVCSLRGSILQLPFWDEKTNTIRLRVRKLYKEETMHINRLLERHAVEGYVFKKTHNFEEKNINILFSPLNP